MTNTLISTPAQVDEELDALLWKWFWASQIITLHSKACFVNSIPSMFACICTCSSVYIHSHISLVKVENVSESRGLDAEQHIWFMGKINGITVGAVTGSLKEGWVRGEGGGFFCGSNGLCGAGGWRVEGGQHVGKLMLGEQRWQRQQVNNLTPTVCVSGHFMIYINRAKINRAVLDTSP